MVIIVGFVFHWLGQLTYLLNREFATKIGLVEPGILPEYEVYELAIAHSHQDMSEVFFVREGVGVIRIDQQEYDLVPGVCVSVEIGEKIHEILNRGTENLILTYFGIQN